MDYDVVIAGAGPAGLALATALAPTGWRVAVIDPASTAQLAAPADDGREIALTHRSIATLGSLDIWARIPSADRAPIRRALIFDGSAPRALVVDARDAGREVLGYLVPNHRIRQAAFEAYAAAYGARAQASLLTGQRVACATTDADAAHITLSGGQRLHARLLIAADSRFSPTRRAVGIAATQRDFGRSMLVCAMTLSRDHQQTAWEWFDHGQTLALLPLNPDPASGRPRASVVVTLPGAEIERLQRCPQAAFEAEMSARFAGRLGAMHLVGERHVYPLIGVWPERITAARFACVGDAAVGMHPVTAHGYNFGLLGVAALGTRLRAAGARQSDPGDTGLLDAYARTQRRATQGLYRATEGIVTLYTDERPPARALRRWLLDAATAFTPFSRALAHRLAS